MTKLCSQRWYIVALLLVRFLSVAVGVDPHQYESSEPLSVRLSETIPEWSFDLSSSVENKEKKSGVTTPAPPPSRVPSLPPPLLTKRHGIFSLRRKKGRISIDIQGNSLRSLSPPLSRRRDLTEANSPTLEHNKPTTMKKNAASSKTEITLSSDPASCIRLAKLSWSIAASFSGAFVGTLRLLGPVIVAKRSINTVGQLGADYLRGRYIRKTYTRLEQLYVRYYDLPASFRSICRILAQLIILFTLSRIMEWMVGIDHAPCRTLADGVSIWCGLLWIFSVVGTGYACSTAVAVWGGPLRIQVDASHMETDRKNAAYRVFTRPWHIFQWMQDPEAWIVNVMSTTTSPSTTQQPSQPFDPNAVLFPVTWVPLRIFQMIAVATAASNCSGEWTSKKRDPVGVIMKQFLISLALSDEWYRVFFGEKRVGLGCFVAFCDFIATLYLVVVTSYVSGFSALLLIPPLLAVFVTGWMNLIIFWNRLGSPMRQAAVDAFYERKDAALKAIKR